MDAYWQSEFRKRMQQFGSASEGFEQVSIKMRAPSGCFHREHSPQAYQIIDHYLAHADFPGVRFHFEEHESGPEILVYLAVTAAGLGFAKSVVELVTAIIKARSEGIKRGDNPRYPLELIVRGHDKGGKFFENKVLDIPPGKPVTVKLIEDALISRNSPEPVETTQLSFDLWLDELEVKELEPFLSAESVVITHRAERMTRSLTGPEVITLIVTLSGVAKAVAGAFGAYFKHSGKRFTASTPDGKIECKNFTADEIIRLIRSSRLLLMRKPKKSKKKALTAKRKLRLPPPP